MKINTPLVIKRLFTISRVTTIGMIPASTTNVARADRSAKHTVVTTEINHQRDFSGPRSEDAAKIAGVVFSAVVMGF